MVFISIQFSLNVFKAKDLLFCVFSLIYLEHFQVFYSSQKRQRDQQHYKFYGRSSRPEVSCKIGVLRNFTKFTRKHLHQILFLNKVATLLKNRLWCRCFPVNFVKCPRTLSLTEYLRWVLLLQFVKNRKGHLNKY